MPRNAADAPDRIDLAATMRTLWSGRTVIAAVALILAIAGYVIGALVIKQRADSFLQLSYTAPVTAPDEKADKEGKELRFRINIAEYKVLSAAVLAREGFIDYATKGSLLDPALVAQLANDMAKENLLTRWVRPVFAIARADLREIPDQPRDEANYLVAIDIEVERRSPKEAMAIAGVLGDYIRDTAILLRAREFVTGMHYKASSRLIDLDRHMISTRLALAQAERKQAEIVAIRERYPDTTRGEVRQVISVDKTTSRFLPPVAQLVGAESQLADLRETMRIAEWDVERSKALAAFLEPAQAIVREARSGSDLFPRLDKLMSETFDAKQLTSDPWRDAFNTLRIEIFGLKTLYFERMRFIAAPAVNEIPLWLQLLPAFIGLLTGVCIASLFVLARARLGPPDASDLPRATSS